MTAVMAIAFPFGKGSFENASKSFVFSTKNAMGGNATSMMALSTVSLAKSARLLPPHEPSSPQATPTITNSFTM